MTQFLLLGITNYEEYSLIQETIEEKKEEGTGTLKKDRTLLRDERKMEKLKAKLHTDDDCKSWMGRLEAQAHSPSEPEFPATIHFGVFLFVVGFFGF